MNPAFVLVHSPSVGPRTWAPIKSRLEAGGAATIMPTLVGVADSGPPFWRVVSQITREAIDQLPADQPIVIVAHSNAGLFVPVVVTSAPRPVAGCIFVDAALPSLSGPTPVATPELLEFLRPKAVDGRLPQWTAWWDDEDVAPMFPDAEVRRAVSAEQPRLPLSYYEELVPVPPGWDSRPCGYLLFGPPYDAMAREAAQRGWVVEENAGQHLHQLVDPDTVTRTIVAMSASWRSSARDPDGG
ncbi:alpha/beta hydrolase [Actinoplanes sp. KI2]|uniref:alpha/beta hydrolase n=1 Tax=Actinoplanes sp. KI2 TaxID=2983315 RepID=UPI0021D5B6D5|nr:alpha/beta hydrolase [Actinoplanes sp. KI2]MCU7724923.1 alpha/beta hydrolase [Actinoplanes sp. KI2]